MNRWQLLPPLAADGLRNQAFHAHGAIRRKEKEHGIEEKSEETAQRQETPCNQDTVEDESTATRTYLARQPDM